MDGKTTLKYVAFYQLLAAVAAILGFAVIGLGVMMGFGESIDIVMQEAPQDWGDAMNAAQPTVFAALAVVGVVVWQLGKTAALVVTMGKVSDASGAAGGADVEGVESEVMERVDDRLSGVEADVKKHEKRLGSDATGSSGAASEDRRSRRRGTAATGDDASSDGSPSTSDASGSSAAEGSNDGASSDAGSSGSESNRRSNRRASRGDGSDGSGSADGDSA